MELNVWSTGMAHEPMPCFVIPIVIKKSTAESDNYKRAEFDIIFLVSSKDLPEKRNPSWSFLWK